MQLANQLELCLHEQTQIVASAACRVGSQEFHSWIASLPLVWRSRPFYAPLKIFREAHKRVDYARLVCHLFPYFYCDSYSLFIFLFISCLFTFYCTIEAH